MKREIYKTLGAAICLLLLGISLQAQIYVSVGVNQPAALSANAGVDENICPGDSAILGGSPAANGGSSPFAYAWSPTTGVGSPAAGNTYASPVVSTSYVLTVTDDRGCTAMDTLTVVVDTCVGMPDPQVPVEMTLFPNPTDGNFSVILSGNYAKTGILRILDPAGRIVREEKVEAVQGTTQKDFRLRNIARGTYLVQFELSEGKLVRRVIIQ